VSEQLAVIPESELVQESENIIWIGETGFEADADKLMVLVDDFSSGHECARCKAKDIRTRGTGETQKQVSVIKCPECGGHGKRAKVGNKNIEVRCTDCDGEGIISCPDCGGRGGLIAIPKKSEGIPTTGRIVSIGPLVPVGKRKLGDRVMFSSYAGSHYDVSGKTPQGAEKEVNLRIVRDDEVMAKLYGVLTLRQLKSAKALYTAE
jgi:co-chaperonin GroES (HSP10)